MKKQITRGFSSLLTIAALIPAIWIVLGLINPSFLAIGTEKIFAATTLPKAALTAPTATCVAGTPQVKLTWPVVTGGTSYSIFRSPTPTTVWTNVVSKQSGTTYTDANIPSSGTYQYQVKTYGNFRSSYSNIVSISVPICPSVVSTVTPQTTVAVTAPVVTKTPTPTVTSAVTAPAATVSSVQWGAYTGDTVADLSALESLVGRAANMQAFFIGFGDPLPTGISALKSANKTLVIFWEPRSDLDSINNGSQDAYMKSFAASVKTYGGPVIMAPYHEMNGNWDVWDGPVGTNSAAKFIAAWKRTHDIFVTAGVTNVKWGWAVNNESVPNTTANSIAAYYPGDTYVDIVGVDGFNFNNGDGWLTFSQVFNSALSQLKVYNKPVYIFSVASAQGTQKATWITDAFTTQLAAHPEVKGWVWFNQNKEANWLVNSDAASLTAFKTVVGLLK